MATPVITPVATPTAPPMAASFSFDIAESSRAQTLDDMGWPQPDFAGGAESGQLPAAEAEPDVFDGVGEGDLVVESLEPEPISLALPDLAAAGAGVDNEVWAVERSALDPFDDPGDVAATASSDAFDAGVETDRAADSAAYGAWDSESAEGSIDAAAPEHTAPFSRDDESWGADDSTPFDTSSNWPDAAPSRGDYAAWDEPAAPATYDDAAHEPPEEVRAAAPELTPEVVDAEHAADVS
ncbi:MAG TPA: hypothetical protein VL242_29395, partial [Sorangium sp.]|nr:hypothetical protein [Sorangium sp.]